VRAVTALLVAVVVGLGFATPAAAAPGPAGSAQWWFDTWQLSAVWAAGARGQGMLIAEIDTGVNAALPELAPEVLPGKDFGDPALDGRTDHQLDAFGHGTAMASLMVARPDQYGISGAAPAAKLLPIAVPIRGTDDAPTVGTDRVPQAIRWATDHGANVISLSLGGQRNPARDQLPCPQEEQNAITYAIGKGTVVVAASGNAGQQGSPVEDPGVCLGVVSVGAVDANGTVANFSSRHPYLTVTAPGVAIPSLGRVPGSAYIGNGTSQATALTAAAIALVWSKYPTLTGRQVVARLLATLDRHVAKPDPAYGYGIVDPLVAVTAAVPATAPNPVFAALDPFLARQTEQQAAAQHPVPPGAATRPLPPGDFAVGPAPSPVASGIVVGAVLGSLGLVVLVALMILGLRARQRYQVRLAAITPPRLPLADPHTPSGLVWYEVTAPEASEPPAVDASRASSDPAFASGGASSSDRTAEPS
jgi:subtilisin family serine protease